MGYFGMMAGPSSVEGAGALGAGGLSGAGSLLKSTSNTPMESAALLMGESHSHATASSPPQGSSSMSIHSSTSRGASEASGSGSDGSSHHNPFAGTNIPSKPPCAPPLVVWLGSPVGERRLQGNNQKRKQPPSVIWVERTVSCFSPPSR